MFVERFWRRAIGVCLLTLVLGGCSVVEDALGDGDDVAETDPSTDDGSVASTETTVAEVFDADAYCSLSHEADVINAEFSAFDDPVALEGFITSLTGVLNEATPPPEIANEFITFRTAYVDLQAQLEAGAYAIEVLQASPILSDANVNAAITAVDAHDLALCGPAPGADPAPAEEAAPVDDGAAENGDDNAATDGSVDDNPFADALASGDFTEVEDLLNSEQGRADFISGFVSTAPGVTPEQAGCFLDNTDIQVLAEMSLDPSNLSEEAVAGFIAALGACDIPLSAFQVE